MAVSLTKGGKVDLAKEAGHALSKLTLGLSWDAKSGNVSGHEFDLDMSAFVVGADGKVLSEQHFVYYKNLSTPNGSVKHSGDNKTGAGEGYDEKLYVEIPQLETAVDKIVVSVSIHDAVARNQSFGTVKNPKIVAIDGDENGTVLSTYELDFDSPGDIVVVFGSLLKRPGTDTWYFDATSYAFPNGFEGLVKEFGLEVE